jgi:hypothetical protein
LEQAANHAFYEVSSARRIIETARESRILRGFERTSNHWTSPRITHSTRFRAHFEALKQAANHAFYEVLSTSKHWNRPRITHFTSFRWIQSIETDRESRILRGFYEIEASKHAANHAFYEVSSTSKHWNRPRITHFTRFWALRSIETGRESRILRGFDEFKALKQAANHAFYEVSMKSKHWNTPRITHFTRFRAPRSIETRRESRILRGFSYIESLHACPESQFGQASENGSLLLKF